MAEASTAASPRAATADASPFTTKAYPSTNVFDDLLDTPTAAAPVPTQKFRPYQLRVLGAVASRNVVMVGPA
eukprot:CAMPEP_0174911770 /NCGR_PEP_ID=MMETSP0167-20121228/78188_1 /TAXON_ID=38298 /ORGANISM="Rhodella maculata, Strain CCMP736" /LENGTH=71 /DNA_ID=CAMNT_0016156349 /DNA_START=110 /DNA_END=321 /DNA_ORIENTATION=+